MVLHAPCFAAISKYQPCAVLRSADGGHTWTAVNVTAPGGEEGESYDAPDVPNNRKYIRLWAASFSEGASSGGITSGCCLPLDSSLLRVPRADSSCVGASCSSADLPLPWVPAFMCVYAQPDAWEEEDMLSAVTDIVLNPDGSRCYI